MHSLKLNLALFAIIVLEGYVVLSSELLAIRQTIPFIGSGTDTVSIIIAAVLMPLAFGYQNGGRFKPGWRDGQYYSVRKKLIFNIITASVFLALGLSYIILQKFFYGLQELGIYNRVVLVSIYSLVFLVTPVYLLGQTIPLVSNYFSKERLSQITGKILFFSTMGSFLGAVFSTLVLMSTIGVHHTVSLNFIILAGLVILLSRKKLADQVIFSICIMGAALYLNSDAMMADMKIVENNKYSTIAVYEKKDGGRILSMNNNNSSYYRPSDGKVHDYVETIEHAVLNPIRYGKEAKDILIIGAGAFTIGAKDTFNNYIFVDIDSSLKEIAEKHILQRSLNENVTFHAIPARGYLSNTKQKFDVIVLDAYFGDMTIPEHLITQEFFQQVRNALKPGGVMAANFIISPNFSTAFSKKVDNTIRSVFPYITRTSTNEDYKIWDVERGYKANVLYFVKNDPSNTISTDDIYTDNLNTMFMDREPKNMVQ